MWRREKRNKEIGKKKGRGEWGFKNPGSRAKRPAPGRPARCGFALYVFLRRRRFEIGHPALQLGLPQPKGWKTVL